jgi:deoxyribodipyrimidine photo-lyase
MKKYQKSLFLFRRDLRLMDNTGLIDASKSSVQSIPCFILDPKLLRKSHPKFSKFRLQFLHECIIDLDGQLQKEKSHLHVFSGNPEKIIESLINTSKIDAVFLNADYTQFSKKRDENIRKVCNKHNVDFIAADDLLLHDVQQIKTLKGKPYKVFSQFFSKTKELAVRKPQDHSFFNLTDSKIKSEIPIKDLERHLGKNIHRLAFKGGRKACLQLMDNLKNLRDYQNDRNFPAMNGTSMLSAHNRFGTCSIREAYHKISQELGPTHPLITELHWRDFFTYIMHHYPHSFSKEFNKKYQKIPWAKNKNAFAKWCDGKTGFPIVDAGMRQLNETGFMHNRVRMIVASFLTKDMHIDWQWGEQYFASKLVDYDPSVNVGNWQWAASTGCDAQPWFRIFNPWLQQRKFDSDCTYIKKWIPELGNLSSNVIHSLDTKYPEGIEYPKPMVEHKLESSHTREIFKKISQST